MDIKYITIMSTNVIYQYIISKTFYFNTSRSVKTFEY